MYHMQRSNIPLETIFLPLLNAQTSSSRINHNTTPTEVAHFLLARGYLFDPRIKWKRNRTKAIIQLRYTIELRPVSCTLGGVERSMGKKMIINGRQSNGGWSWRYRPSGQSNFLARSLNDSASCRSSFLTPPFTRDICISSCAIILAHPLALSLFLTP